MPLAAGTRLGPYEILCPIGAGGMGEVYRARDTRLDRVVAIKVLPESFSQDPDVRARFEHEARAISKLSHPNICTIHDIGRHDGVDFIVLEFVEGSTLRHLLVEGVLPIRRVIPIAVQVADALAKAHETGIIHRDLKPENLMVSTELVKILDFGLAKWAAEADEAAVGSGTTVGAQTRDDTVLGTVEYMSPEQASGQPLDFRSDQFSFGLVLYEMAAGKHAFHKRTAAQTLLAIVREDPPPLNAVNPDVPPPLCWVVERCLAKEPEKRYFSTRDLASDLAAIRDRLSDLDIKRPEARPSNLPPPGTALVGREQELASLKELVLRPTVRLVTVTGPGGIGKSRLGLEAARELTHSFPGGVYFVPLSAVSDSEMVALAIAQTLGVHESAGHPARVAIKEHLQHVTRSPVLLLIDNFEQVVAAAPLLSELLAVAANLKIIVTSRAALRVYDEHEFPVPPLSLPDETALPDLTALSKYPAISLFVQRAVAVRPDFKLTEENAPAVAEICARLDGLPLAIELAAARVKLLTPAAMRTRLASRLQLLTGGARDLPARQQTLRQAIDWSYDLLNEDEQRLFRRLSVFLGGCTLEAVESVCNTKSDLGLDVLDGMASMVDKSLVRQIEQPDGEPRFLMLETIREYGLEKLHAASELAATRRAHAAYCLVLAEDGAAENDPAKLGPWLERFELENGNFRVALDSLIESGDADWGLRLGVALFRFWEMREHLSEGRDRLGKLLRLPKAAAPSQLRMRGVFCLSVLTGGQGDYAAAEALTKESLEIARQIGDKEGVAVALNALALNALVRRELDVARTFGEESVVLWKELGDPAAIARAVSNQADIARLQKDFPRSRSLYEEALLLFRQSGDRTGVAWALNHQGDVARDQKDWAGARSLYERSLATFYEVNDHWGIAGSLADLGNLERNQEDFPAAIALYRESLRMFQHLAHKRGIARLLESFAAVAAAQSESERALRLAGAAAALRQSIGAPLTPVEAASLERSLEPARRGLATSAGGAAWLEGWVMPVEKAIEDVLSVREGDATSQTERVHRSAP
jgi:predicted ATPase/serine/threonine protein kinase